MASIRDLETAPAGYRQARDGIAHRMRDDVVVDVTGAERASFLQGQLTQDVRGITTGACRPAAALTPKGKLLYVARVLGLPDRIRLLVPAALGPLVLEHLRKYAVFTKVEIEDRGRDFVEIGLYGEGADRLEAPEGVVRLPAHWEFSGGLLVPAERRAAVEALLDSAGSFALPEATAEILRVEAGRPLFGADMDGSNLPDEVGMNDAISTTKGCYVGQEVVARLRTYGRVNRRLVRLRFPDGPLAPGDALRREGDEAPSKVEAGRVTSSVVSPAAGPIGLGYAFRDVPAGARLVSPSGLAAIVSEIRPA